MQMWSFWPSVDLTVATTRAQLDQFVERYGCHVTTMENAAAWTNFIQNVETGHGAAIIYMNKGWHATPSEYALLAHECVHVAQHYFRDVVLEDRPSDEFYAYAVQAVMMAALTQLGEDVDK